MLLVLALSAQFVLHSRNYLYATRPIAFGTCRFGWAETYFGSPPLRQDLHLQADHIEDGPYDLGSLTAPARNNRFGRQYPDLPLEVATNLKPIS